MDTASALAGRSYGQGVGRILASRVWRSDRRAKNPSWACGGPPIIQVSDSFRYIKELSQESS